MRVVSAEWTLEEVALVVTKCDTRHWTLCDLGREEICGRCEEVDRKEVTDDWRFLLAVLWKCEVVEKLL